MKTNQSTLNAKVGAIGLVVGAAVLHLINQNAHSLIPIRLLTLGVLVLGIWAFSDEMGMRKPLNRAALISFIFSVSALAVTILEPDVVSLGKYYLIYAFTLLISLLMWSAAFLHRQKELKIFGAMGAAASILPLTALVLGHISIGAGAFLGVSTLLDLRQGAALLTSTPIRGIEAVFIVWSTITGYFLWNGGMTLGRSDTNGVSSII